MTPRPSGDWPRLERKSPAQEDACNRARASNNTTHHEDIRAQDVECKAILPRICATCAWFAAGEVTELDLSAHFRRHSNLGECRAAPPSIGRKGDHTAGMACWPVTLPGRWCAAWTPTQGDR